VPAGVALASIDDDVLLLGADDWDALLINTGGEAVQGCLYSRVYGDEFLCVRQESYTVQPLDASLSVTREGKAPFHFSLLLTGAAAVLPPCSAARFSA
jgi:hypothetical protein